MSIEFLFTTLVIVATPGTGALYTLAAGLSRDRRLGLPHPRRIHVDAEASEIFRKPPFRRLEFRLTRRHIGFESGGRLPVFRVLLQVSQELVGCPPLLHGPDATDACRPRAIANCHPVARVLVVRRLNVPGLVGRRRAVEQVRPGA